MIAFTLFSSFLAALCFILIMLWNIRRSLGQATALIRLNTGGENLTKRLFPNLAYLMLFMILFRLSGF